jgi:O-antigen/teichoic acid export membrane protein
VLEEIKKLLKHSSVYSLGNILNKAVGFLLIPFYTHYLTTADYGTLELLDLSVTLVGLLLNMWMNASLVRHYYEYEDNRNRNEVVSTAMIATSTSAALVSAAGFFWARWISILILKSPQFYLFVRVIAFNLFFTCLNSVSFSYLRARQKSSLIVAMNSASLVMSLGLNIYFLAGLKTGVIGVLYSGLIANGLVTTALTISTIREAGLNFGWSKLKALAAFGLPLILTSFSAFELNFADRFFLEHYSTVSTVGIYALGYKFGYMLSFLLIQPFMMIWGARMYEVAKRPDAGVLFSKIIAYFTLLLSAAALAMSLVIKEVIAVVSTSQFHQAYKIVPAVALAYVFYGISYYFQTGVYISKKTAYLGLMGAVCATANIALNFWLIPRYAAMGAAWATALSFLLMAILAYVFSQRVYRVPYSLFRVALPVVAAVGIYFISNVIEPPSLLVAIAWKLLLLVGFGFVVFALGFFDESEVLQLRHTLQMARGRLRWGIAGSAGR